MTSFSASARLVLLAASALVACPISPLGRAQTPPAADPLAADPVRLAALWNALGAEREDVAAPAIDALAAEPAAALALIERELAPLVGDVNAQVRRLVAQLRQPKFDQRERAQAQLAALGALAEPELRRQLAAGLPLEAQTRVAQLLARIPGPIAATPADRRLVRLVPLLERIDDPRARPLLAALEPVRKWPLVDSRVPPLYAQLSSSNPIDRAVGGVALLQLGDAAIPVLPRLVDLLGEVGPLVTLGSETRSVADHVTAAFPAMGRRAVEALIAALERPSAEIRRRAVMLLGVQRDDRALEPLIALLGDADPSVAAQASAAIARYGAKAVPKLLDALADPRPAFRGMAAATLANTRDLRAVKPLARLLDDDDAGVRQYAIQSLQPFKAAALDELIAALTANQPPIRDDARLRLQIVAQIVTINDPRVYEPLIAALDDAQPDIRSLALSFLLLQRRDAFDDPRLAEKVVEGLADDAPNVRIAAANVLSQAVERAAMLDRQRVAAALIAALDDENDGVRAAAAEAAGAWKLTGAVDALLRRLDDAAVRVLAAEALGRIGDPRAIAPLRRLLPGQDPRVIVALGELGDRASVPALIALLERGPASAQQAAAQALGKMRDPRAVDPLIALMRTGPPFIHDVARALGDIGDPRAVEPLLEVCRNPPGPFGAQLVFTENRLPEQQPAAWPLFSIGVPAIEPLAGALADDAPTAREVAAWVLYNLRSQGGASDAELRPAVAPLAAALDDASGIVRVYAAETLADMGDRRAATALLDALIANPSRESGTFVDGNIPTYLGRLRDPETVPPLIDMLEDNRPPVRAGAARALGMIRDQRAVAPLTALLTDGAPEVRAEAIAALGHLKADAAVDALVALLGDDAAELRAAAAESLGRIGAPRAADPLAKLAADDSFEVQLAAGLALVRLDDDRGAALIARGLADNGAERREQAATAVATSFVNSERLVAALTHALADPALRVRLYAAVALGHIGSPAAVDALLARLDDRQNLTAILRALANSKSDRAFPALIAALDDAQADVRAQAVDEVGVVDIPHRVELIASRLADPAPEVRLAAIDRLCRLNARQAIPQIEPLVADPHPRVAARAARAIQQLRAATE
jgi:HEAT repeat protein